MKPGEPITITLQLDTVGANQALDDLLERLHTLQEFQCGGASTTCASSEEHTAEVNRRMFQPATSNKMLQEHVADLRKTLDAALVTNADQEKLIKEFRMQLTKADSINADLNLQLAIRKKPMPLHAGDPLTPTLRVVAEKDFQQSKNFATWKRMLDRLVELTGATDFGALLDDVERLVKDAQTMRATIHQLQVTADELKMQRDDSAKAHDTLYRDLKKSEEECESLRQQLRDLKYGGAYKMGLNDGMKATKGAGTYNKGKHDELERIVALLDSNAQNDLRLISGFVEDRPAPLYGADLRRALSREVSSR